jgi:tetratricopeptide (TPR) repeat protein
MRGTLTRILGSLGLALATSGCHLPLMPGSTSAASDVPATPTAIKGGRVEASPSETAKLRFATGMQLEGSGKSDEAIALYEYARASDSQYTEPAARRLAVLYDRQGNFDKARVEYERILVKNPKDADTLNNLGYGYYRREHWDLAEQHLRKALAASPDHKAAWVNLGMTLAQKQQYAEALSAFGKAVPPAKAQCNLAFVLMTQGKRDEAKQAYREALRMDPGLEFAQMALAKLDSPGPATTLGKDAPGNAVHPASRVTPSPAQGNLMIDTESPFIVDPADAMPVPAQRSR